MRHFIGPLPKREYLLARLVDLLDDRQPTVSNVSEAATPFTAERIKGLVGVTPLHPDNPPVPVEFNPTHKLILACSHLPDGRSDSFLKRLQRVDFPQSFARNEQGPSGLGRE